MIAGVIAAAAGCSSSSNSSGPPDTAHFANTMATTFCGALHSCCDAAKIAYDDGSCVAQLQASFQSSVDVVKHGKVIYDPSAVGACQDAIKSRESACSEDGGAAPSADAGYIDPIASACWPVLKGTVAPGGPCTSSAECQTPGPNVVAGCAADTRPGADTSVKVCWTITEHVMPGAACRSMPKTGAFDTAQCEGSLGYCDTSNAPMDDRTAGTCKAYANVGDSCVGMTGQTPPQCNPKTSYCDAFTSMKCVALPGTGAPCSTSNYRCAPGNYCDYTAGTSATCAASKADGSDCKTSQECASNYCQTTIGDGGIQTGTCTPTGNVSHNAYDVSPRTCGFGPSGSGPEDAGIVPPAKTSAVPLGAPWYVLR